VLTTKVAACPLAAKTSSSTAEIRAMGVTGDLLDDFGAAVVDDGPSSPPSRSFPVKPDRTGKIGASGPENTYC
jgi:hypothetical protein